MRIYVNQKDIDDAIEARKNKKLLVLYCPIAIALKRKGYDVLGVGLSSATIGIGNKFNRYKIQSTGQFLIDAFDSDKKVKPTHVTLTKETNND